MSRLGDRRYAANGDESSSAGFEIASHFPRTYGLRSGEGHILMSPDPVILPHRKALNPDAAYHDRALSKHGRT